LADVESVLASLKESSRRHDDESRRVSDEVRQFRDLIPKALDVQKESVDARLRELGAELKSLKTLVSNRLGAGAGVSRAGSSVDGFGPKGLEPSADKSATSRSSHSRDVSEAGQDAAGVGGEDRSASAPNREENSSPYGRIVNGRAAIPAWQLAASKKSQDEKERKDTSDSGTVTEVNA
jgi:peroxin-14